jgi:polyether ionophore transport system permease protein
MTAFTGTGTLLRLALRRDRIMLPIWIAALFVFAASSAASVQDLYPTLHSRIEFAAGMSSNPSTLAIYGPSWDLTTLGGIATLKLGVYGTVLLALMSLFTVTRHTRGDEEPGRLELVGAGVVGRRAPLTAAVLVALGANVVAAAFIAVGLMAGGVPAGGSLTYGLALGSVGWVFTGIAAVTAQLTESSRTANSIAASALGVAYLLRAIGDASTGHAAGWLSWLSPLGWALRVRSFAPTPHWWVFVLPVVATVLLVALGYVLVARRDMGAGLLPARLGPAYGAASLRSPLALAWRLQRGSLIGWSVAFLVAGGALGSIADGVTDLTGGSKAVKDMFHRMGGEQGMVNAYLAACMGVVGMVAAGYAVQATLRLRGEETALRAEPLLAARVSRFGWAASHLVFAVFGPAVLLAMAGLSAGLAHGVRSGDAGAVPRMIGAAEVQWPGSLVVAAIALVLLGVLPRLTTIAWGVLIAFLALTLFGELLNLNQRVLDVSPFTHIPKLPGSTFTATPLLWLLAVTVVLGGIGLAGLRRRDIG